MTQKERMHATTSLNVQHLVPEVDETEHAIDPELITESEDEVKVWV